MKCHAGVEYPDGKPCPKCGAKLGEVCWPGINNDLAEVAKLRIENAQLRSQVEGARAKAFEEAMDALDLMRSRSATNFTDDNCKGQRGVDRCDALYDAYHAIRRLSISSTERGQG